MPWPKAPEMQLDPQLDQWDWFLDWLDELETEGEYIESDRQEYEAAIQLWQRRVRRYNPSRTTSNSKELESHMHKSPYWQKVYSQLAEG